MHPKSRGIQRAELMRHWLESRGTGGRPALPDHFDRSTPDSLANLMDEWLRHLTERAYSPRTLHGRQWRLYSFLEWAQQRDLHRPQQITKPILESYQRWLFQYRTKHDRPLGITTQRLRLQTLKSFFSWLGRENRLLANPAADLELPRKRYRSLPRALSPEEINAVFNVPDIRDPLGIRDRAMLELFYATGIRRAELARLDLDDIDHHDGLLLVREGKGGKDRMVPIGEQALHWLQRYQEQTRPRLATHVSENALFLTGYGQRFNPDSIGNIVRQIFNAAKIGRQGSCHLFRHSCATHMLENGADIRFIQQLLGHAKLETTSIYTEVSIVQLREVYARCHPAAKLPVTDAVSKVASFY